MAKLTTAARKAEPAKDFGLPKERKYPMPDKSHAADAKARASEMEHKGRITPGQERQIDRKADAKLGERNANRTADRVVARLSKHKPVK